MVSWEKRILWYTGIRHAMETSDQAPKIEFPCGYPIKVIGHHSADFQAFVVSVVAGSLPTLTAESVTARPSRNGRFLSVRLQLWATGEDQLLALFRELRANPQVQMVL